MKTERKEKFTAGDYTHRPGNTTILDSENHPVAMVYQAKYWRTKEEAAANVRLLEAAPKMYYSLKDCAGSLCEILQLIVSGQDLPDTIIAMAQDEVDKAAETLKKIRGEA